VFCCFRQSIRIKKIYIKNIHSHKIKIDHPHEGGRKHLWNVSRFLVDCTALHPRTPPFSITALSTSSVIICVDLFIEFIYGARLYNARFNMKWRYEGETVIGSNKNVIISQHSLGYSVEIHAKPVSITEQSFFLM
jgi:hypothetical protein